MKIAFITEACSAGVGRHVIDAALCHARAGHEMHVLHSTSRMDSRFAAGLDHLRREGGESKAFDIGHQPGLDDVAAVRHIRSYLVERGRFDVVHCHSTKAGLVGRIAAIGLGSRVVYTPHAFFSMSPGNGIIAQSAIQLLERSLAVVSDGIICVSEEERRHAESIGIPPRKLRTIPNGIDEAEAQRAAFHRLRFRRRFNIGDNNVCIGFVGRLVKQKDPELLLKAFLKRLRELPGYVRLVFAGDGPLMPALAEKIADAGAGDRVLLAGQVDGLQAMSAFDLFALPSQYEGFPYVLLEALAMGLPIISTAVGGARAITIDGENGVVVQTGDTDRFANALLLLTTNHELRRQMAENSRRRSAHFSISRMIAETEMAYRLPTSTIGSKLNQPVASRSPKTAITD